jgi:hypothetical protein
VHNTHPGSVTPLVAAIIALCGVMAMAIAEAGTRIVADERASIVAESAALAGIHGGEQAARVVAQRNGGVLERVVDTRNRDGRFAATIIVDDRHATATAADSWAPVTPTLEP